MCLYSINCSEKEFNFTLFTRKYYKNNPYNDFFYLNQKPWNSALHFSCTSNRLFSLNRNSFKNFISIWSGNIDFK